MLAREHGGVRAPVRQSVRLFAEGYEILEVTVAEVALRYDPP